MRTDECVVFINLQGPYRKCSVLRGVLVDWPDFVQIRETSFIVTVLIITYHIISRATRCSTYTTS